jgi:ATP-dependent DNA helicase RecG
VAVTQQNVHTTTESLKKILDQEQKTGNTDRVVMGGLDRFLEQPSVYRILRSLGLPHIYYAGLDKKQRRTWIDLALKVVRDDNKTPPQQLSHSGMGAKERVAISLDSPVTHLRRVSTGLASKLQKLDVTTVRDLIYLFPTRHQDYSKITTISQLEVGKDQTVVVNVWEAHEKSVGVGQRIAEAIVGDETGNIRVVWFNQPYLAKSFHSNMRLVISGRVTLHRGQKVFEGPEYELLIGQDDLLHTGRLVPVYPLTAGLGGRTMRRIIKEALDLGIQDLRDHLPNNVISRLALMELRHAIMNSHYPENMELKEKARRRLAFDEFFQMQLAILAQKRFRQQGLVGNPIAISQGVLNAFLESLPFTLTAAQEHALEDILNDSSHDGHPMSRLLQGEVGSGKTVVALAALLMAVASEHQGAIMAPTEVLAEQHFLTVSRLLDGLATTEDRYTKVATIMEPTPRTIKVGLLVGSMKKRDKEKMHRNISSGEVDIIIGTHAIVQEEVTIPNLALVVVDEQHRFGVLQRASLRLKGKSPHVLVMSATPIPRTLALTLYGDLDISVIDQLPAGRKPIRTKWVQADKRANAYAFVHKEIMKGRQAFVICPLIEGSETIEAKAAIEEYQRLSQDIFPDLRLGLLHGRMTLMEKQQVMEELRKGSLDILVATLVIEVGIDVPNATVMMVEGADRFGLSQLHQLRGRVGRGKHSSYCLLLADSASPEARERLQSMEIIQDGFALAEIDLLSRGPGDMFGTRQSGLPDLKMASLSDRDLLASAQKEAIRMLDSDPQLSQTQHEQLLKEIQRRFGKVIEELS